MRLESALESRTPTMAVRPQHRDREADAVTAPNDSFPRWLTRLQARDGDAAREVFQRYARPLLALARRQFGAGLRHKVDPEDVVQSAYKSFFWRCGEGNLEVGSWNGLWGLLTLITMRKCADRVEYYRAQCRD